MTYGIMNDMIENIDINDVRWLVSEFGLDLKSRSKDELLEKMIGEEGITIEMMEDALKRREQGSSEEPTFTKKDPVVLVKMQRFNPTFMFRGYKFTKDHPFVLMNEVDANAIMMMESGFARATVQEAEAYYGGS
jgi:hypothetical protein